MNTIGEQSKGDIALNVKKLHGRSLSVIKGVGAHEAFHQVEASRGDKTNQSMYTYSDKMLKKAHGSWAKRNNSQGIGTDVNSEISKYPETYRTARRSSDRQKFSAETLSEAANNVSRYGRNASSLSRSTVSTVSRDITHSKVGGKRYKVKK